MDLNIKNFKSGVYQNQYRYKSFLPSTINRQWIWDNPAINTLLEQAACALGQLNAFSAIVPDVDLFIQMHILKEAQNSSRIEGTKTGMDEALLLKEDLSPEKRDDWQEVQNYIEAMHFGLKQLEQLPLSSRLLKQMHKILMQGVRGEYKCPGEFRKSQNWIGGSAIFDAVYIPPVHTELPDLMSDLEKFLHNHIIEVPHLIKIAISHYQFESIHPFLDGNGRIGRLLITFYLVNNKLLSKPSLYLSAFFEKHKAAYYDALSRVREAHDMVHWIKFFLSAVIETANIGQNTFHQILVLQREVDEKITELGRRLNISKAFLRLLYKKPIVTVSETAKSLNLTPKSANMLIKGFVQLGIVQEITGYRRNQIFAFKKYLALFA